MENVLTQEFWDNVNIMELDNVRIAMRDLLQYIDRVKTKIYYTNFEDEITEGVEGKPIYDTHDLKDYRKKVEYYLKEHSNNLSVYKLRNNKKLSEADLKSLEKLLWEELGSKSDYAREYGDTPIGRLVRRIVGVDRSVVNEAFSEFLTTERLNINQIHFVNLIVDYIVANGNIDDNNIHSKLYNQTNYYETINKSLQVAHTFIIINVVCNFLIIKIIIQDKGKEKVGGFF